MAIEERSMSISSTHIYGVVCWVPLFKENKEKWGSTKAVLGYLLLNRLIYNYRGCEFAFEVDDWAGGTKLAAVCGAACYDTINNHNHRWKVSIILLPFRNNFLNP